jgi:hypothetical protein
VLTVSALKYSDEAHGQGHRNITIAKSAGIIAGCKLLDKK